MDITRALQHAVKKSWKHGTVALAAALGISSDKVLLAKVSPEREDTHCSPEEMLQIMQATGDHSALFAMAEDLGYVLLKNPAGKQGTDIECTRHLVATVREFGEFIETVTEAAADHDITANELRDIHEKCADAQSVLLSLDAWAEQRHSASRPSYLRAAA